MIFPALHIGQGDNEAFLAGAQVAGQAQDRRMRNQLLERQMADEQAEAERRETYNNLLAQFIGPETALAVEESMAPNPDEILNHLYRLDPERTAKLVEHQESRRAAENEWRRKTAQEIVSRMEFVLQSDHPAQALRLAGRFSDNSDLIEWMTAEGMIDPSDGIDDDEALMVARTLIMGNAPFLETDAQRAEPSLIREMRAVGIDPATPEGRETWLALKVREGATDAELEKLRLQMTQFTFEREQRAEAEKERTAEQHRQVAKVELGNSARYLAELADLNAKLASTWARSGSVGLDQRRAVQMTRAEIGELLGIPQNEARQVLAWLDRANKLSSELLIASLGRVAGAGMGQLTNDRLRLSAQTMPGLAIDPQANNLLIADKLEELLQISEIEGIEVPDVDTYRQRVEQLRGAGAAAPPVQPVFDVPGAGRRGMDAASAVALEAAEIGRLNADQIRALDSADFERMSDEQRVALSDRMRELGF